MTFAVQLVALLFIYISGAVDGTFTFLYLVGLEGVGHHGVTTFLADLTFSCGRYFYPRNNGEGSFIDKAYGYVAQGDSLENMYGMFRYYVEQGIVANKTHPELATIFFSSSFPRYSYTRHPTSWEQVKNDHNYDLEGIITNINQVTRNHPGQEVNIKFLYLEREPFHSVTAHCENDAACKPHAHYMSIFHHFIQEEYNITSSLYAQFERQKLLEKAKNMSSNSTKQLNNKRSGLWAKIVYEWFLVPEQCADLMSTIAEFLEWNADNNCDFETACAKIRSEAEGNKPRKHDGAINCDDYRYIHERNLTVDQIPLLKGSRQFKRGINETELMKWKNQCNDV